MKKEDAIEYLQRKGKIRDDEVKHPKWTAEEKAEIAKVEKSGKIYGDPAAEIHW